MPDLDSVLRDPRRTLRNLLSKARRKGPVYDPKNGPQDEDHKPEKDVIACLNMGTNKAGDLIVRKTKRNLMLILQTDTRWKDRLWVDSFRRRLMYEQRDYMDSDDTRILMWVERIYGVEYPAKTVCEVATVVGEAIEFNPLVSWLESLEWDGAVRTDQWLIKAAGVQDTEIHRKIGRAWLIQAVARAMKPGCKADCCLILIGPQGAQKSSLFRVIASDKYFSDTPIDIGSKDAYLQIAESWIYEVAELDSVKRASSSTTKAFISAQYDIFRPPFGRQTVRVPRHVCFCGSTNETTFLFDPTGSRRFWPVEVGAVDLEWARQNREQIWAEAVHAYENGEVWWLEKSAEEQLAACSATYQKPDPWQELIEDWLFGNAKRSMTTRDIMRGALTLEPYQMTKAAEMRVAEILRAMNWERKKLRLFGRPQWCWVRDAEIFSMSQPEENVSGTE